MEINRNNIFDLLKKCDIHPSKDFGQNFLVDSKLCKKIVDSLNIGEGEKVLEIGPGLGSLTHFLLESSSKNINVVDVDPNMIAFLNVFYKEAGINIIENDIRKEDVSSYDKIIGNLPYNITTELITYLLLNAKRCKKFVLMTQLEAYNRFSDTKGKEYGAISVLVHMLGDTKKLFNVGKGSFVPSPKVDSIVFEINVSEGVNREEVISIYKLAKSLFLNRRKTLYNNLARHLGNKELAANLIEEMGLKPTVRPEELPPESFKKLYFLVKSVEKK